MNPCRGTALLIKSPDVFDSQAKKSKSCSRHYNNTTIRARGIYHACTVQQRVLDLSCQTFQNKLPPPSNVIVNLLCASSNPEFHCGILAVQNKYTYYHLPSSAVFDFTQNRLYTYR